MVDIERFLSGLEKVKSRGQDKWISCCPAHDDKSPSMVSEINGEGKLIVHCFAGCTPEEIMGSVGMTMSDMFPQQHTPRKYYNKKQLDELGMQAYFLGVCYSDLNANKAVSRDDLTKARRCLKSLRSEYRELKNQGYRDLCKRIDAAVSISKNNVSGVGYQVV